LVVLIAIGFVVYAGSAQLFGAMKLLDLVKGVGA
jgi:hypothetical protein